MTNHDRVRKENAEKCDRNNIEDLHDAIRGLQSTDDPDLVPLHDELLGQLNELEKKKKRKRKKK